MCRGKYRFQRTIDDRYAGVQHTASGILEISDTEWNESGVLHSLDDSPFYQQYILNFIDTGLQVWYPSGMEFYRLSQIYGTHQIHHQCGDDLYQGTWVHSTGTLKLMWQVKGLRKDYTMVTMYTIQKSKCHPTVGFC